MTEPSQRLIDQRVRNRIIETLIAFAKGDTGVREVGAIEYFERYYDYVPHRDDGDFYPNSAFTIPERSALSQVSKVVDDACDDTPQMVTNEQLLESGWPRRIQTVAQTALDLMQSRGCFSEEHEEDEPSSR